MKHLLALVALAVVASGQQNDGVNGVTLTGTAQAPGIHNLSGRTVIYIILKLDYTEGPSTYLPGQFSWWCCTAPGLFSGGPSARWRQNHLYCHAYPTCGLVRKWA